MKRLLAATIIATLPLGASADSHDGKTDMQADIDQSKMAIKDFFGSLKGELVQAMKAGGPVNAIHVCNTRAQLITKEKAQAHGLHLARTSLKVRNPVNAPDAWELATMKQFESRKAAGEPVDQIAKAEVVTGADGKKQFRFMKAIPTGQVCLTCHGDNIAPEVAAKLDELYPEDRARGFKLGDIRGAFTVSKEM
jgi:hypothetical protein